VKWLRRQLAPLPPPLRVVVLVVLVLVVLVLLVILFEWAGNLLDTGGAVGV
jgi:hypothetical protein